MENIKGKSLTEKLLSKVKANPGLTDRELTDRIYGRDQPQQYINQLARALEGKGLLIRRHRPDELIGNYATDIPVQVAMPKLRQLNETDLDGLSEDSLKAHLKLWLEADGWTANIAWGKMHGTDIIGKRDAQRWLIEVKGCGSRAPMRVNYFLAVLGELLQRMTDDAANYSIALPDMPQFRGLWEKLPPLAKKRTGISAIFVSRNGTVELIH